MHKTAIEHAPTLTYESGYSGLLIVDPYNDFLSKGGKLYELSRSTLEAHDVVEHMRQVLSAARAASVQVFIAPHHRWRESDLLLRWKAVVPVQAATARGRVFADGTWGGSFHPDFEPHPGDVVAQEHWLSSGFANTDLDLQLQKLGIRKVIVIGALKSYILDKRYFSCKSVCRSIHPRRKGRRLDQELDWRENGVHGGSTHL
jgi:nicotinamidase-related amidase